MISQGKRRGKKLRYVNNPMLRPLRKRRGTEEWNVKTKPSMHYDGIINKFIIAPRSTSAIEYIQLPPSTHTRG